MYAEIQATINFLSSYLFNKLPRRKILLFGEQLANYLILKFQNHWYTSAPYKGSAFRCIRVSASGLTDALVGAAAESVGISLDDLLQYLPNDLTLWVDPGEVSYRSGEYGTVSLLYSESSMTTSMNPLHYLNQKLPPTHPNPAMSQQIQQLLQHEEVDQQQQQQQQHLQNLLQQQHEQQLQQPHFTMNPPKSTPVSMSPASFASNNTSPRHQLHHHGAGTDATSLLNAAHIQQLVANHNNNIANNNFNNNNNNNNNNNINSALLTAALGGAAHPVCNNNNTISNSSLASSPLSEQLPPFPTAGNQQLLPPPPPAATNHNQPPNFQHQSFLNLPGIGVGTGAVAPHPLFPAACHNYAMESPSSDVKFTVGQFAMTRFGTTKLKSNSLAAAAAAAAASATTASVAGVRKAMATAQLGQLHSAMVGNAAQTNAGIRVSINNSSTLSKKSNLNAKVSNNNLLSPQHPVAPHLKPEFSSGGSAKEVHRGSDGNVANKLGANKCILETSVNKNVSEHSGGKLKSAAQIHPPTMETAMESREKLVPPQYLALNQTTASLLFKNASDANNASEFKKQVHNTGNKLAINTTDNNSNNDNVTNNTNDSISPNDISPSTTDSSDNGNNSSSSSGGSGSGSPPAPYLSSPEQHNDYISQMLARIQVDSNALGLDHRVQQQLSNERQRIVNGGVLANDGSFINDESRQLVVEKLQRQQQLKQHTGQTQQPLLVQQQQQPNGRDSLLQHPLTMLNNLFTDPNNNVDNVDSRSCMSQHSTIAKSDSGNFVQEADKPPKSPLGAVGSAFGLGAEFTRGKALFGEIMGTSNGWLTPLSLNSPVSDDLTGAAETQLDGAMSPLSEHFLLGSSNYWG